MAELNGLPVYKIKINEDLNSNQGIDFISLVDFPAIETNWIALSNEKAPLKFTLNQDKQLLSGPILIPDMPIYRYSKQMGEFYVVFTAEEIQKLVRKFQAQQKTINLNVQHKDNSQLSKAVVQEIWLTGKVDKSQTLGFELPENSAFVVTHIGDQKFWNEEVKTGNVKGFSIEGFLDMEMKKLNKIKMVTAKTMDGTLEITTQADAFAIGADVTTMDQGGASVPVPDGDYELENGSQITVAGGKITALVEAAPGETLSEEEVAAMEKVFAPLFDKYEARIKELETKLSNMPGAKPITEVKEPEVKPTAAKTALDKLNKIKTIYKK